MVRGWFLEWRNLFGRLILRHDEAVVRLNLPPLTG
jgi:hypothetical protein